MSRSSDDQPRDSRSKFSQRRRGASENSLVSLPTDWDLFNQELDLIDHRILNVISAGRGAFFDGSPSYDQATVAIVRLAALFEDNKRFEKFLEPATDTERTGIIATRNISAHRGYAAMNDDVFWETVTVQVSRFIAKIRSTNAAGV